MKKYLDVRVFIDSDKNEVKLTRISDNDLEEQELSFIGNEVIKYVGKNLYWWVESYGEAVE